MSDLREVSCPVCGYYCLGRGGDGCIDKPTLNDGRNGMKYSDETIEAIIADCDGLDSRLHSDIQVSLWLPLSIIFVVIVAAAVGVAIIAKDIKRNRPPESDFDEAGDEKRES